MSTERVHGFYVQRGRFFGRNRLLQVPQLEGAVLAGCDQYRLRRMERQGSNAIEVAPQSVFGVPCLTERLLVHRNL